MKLLSIFDRLQLFTKLVEQGRTGSPDEFANRLGISRTSLYLLIDELKSMGVNIYYSRRNRTFLYKNPVNIDVNFTINHLEDLGENESAGVTGGVGLTASVLFSVR